MALPKSKQPKKDNKSYHRLKSAINDPLILVKFRFFAKTAAELKFLVLYQTEKPMVTFIAQSVEDIIHSFISTFMLEEKFKAAKTCLSLSKINFKDYSCHKRATDANPSIPIKTELSDLKKNGEISDAQFLKFKSDLASFLSALCAHLVEKSQIKYSLTRNAQCFIPNLLLEAPETSEKRFNHLLEDLFTSQKMPGKMVAEAKHEFTKFLKDVVTTHKEEFWGFDMAVKDHRLDSF